MCERETHIILHVNYWISLPWLNKLVCQIKISDELLVKILASSMFSSITLQHKTYGGMLASILSLGFFNFKMWVASILYEFLTSHSTSNSLKKWTRHSTSIPINLNKPTEFWLISASQYLDFFFKIKVLYLETT